MGRSDLEAVAARRAAVVRELTEMELKRAELLAEDQDLEVTERVLKRLADLFYADSQPVTRSLEGGGETTRNGAPGIIQGLLVGSLLAGRGGWTKIRSAVERRVDQIARHSR